MELQPAGLPGGEAVFRPGRGRCRRRASRQAWMREGSYRSDQGAVWREVSYSLRENQASPTSDYREGRAKVSHQIDSFVERVQPVDGQVGAIFLCARGILGLELLGEEDLFKRCLAKIIRSFAFEVLNDEDLGSVPEDAAAFGGRARRRPPFEASPGAGYDLRIDTGEVIGSGLYRNHSLPPVVLSGRTRDPSERPPRRAPAGQRSRNLRRQARSGRQQDAA